VDAYIQISPQNATNNVGTQHTLTITVNANPNTGSIVAGTATATILASSTTGGFDPNTTTPPTTKTCNYPAGPSGSSSCTVVIDSAVTGETDVQASSTISQVGVGGSVTRTTGTIANVTAGCTSLCDNAVKHWVDAFIQISPQNATNPVNTTHTLTITVNANPATGTVAAGTATATILASSTTGGFDPNTTTPPTTATCNYAQAVGSSSCTVVIKSTVTGETDVQASSTISQVGVGGSVTRTTGTIANVTAGCTSLCDNAVKHWVDAYIQISPQNATNNVGTQHTLTITVVSGGGGSIVAGTATATILASSTTGGFDPNTTTPPTTQTCNYPAGPSGSSSCTVVIDSAVNGETDVQASSAISQVGVPGSVTRTTGTIANVTAGCLTNCDNAVKHWVDAYIQITPQDATNPVPSNHTLTITVNANPNTGTIAAGTATATILASSTTGGFAPNTTTPPTTATCNYAQAVGSSSCTVVIRSAAAGETDVQASSTISQVGAAGSVTRTTGSIANVTAGCTANCDNANKVWLLTHVLDSTNTDITNGTIAGPATVHDTFSGAAALNGDTVTFTLFQSGNCTGTTVGSAQTVTIAGGSAATTPVTLSPTSTTTYSFLAHYNGTKFPAASAACEPFTVSFVQIFHGCTPGFWKNHGSSLWDSAGDNIPKAMPAGLLFFQNTKFDAYFGVTAAQSGIPTTASMIDVLNMGGGGGIALGRQAVSALLSVAAGMPYMFPSPATDFTSLYNLIVQSYKTGNPAVGTLEGQLDAANSKEDPPLC
jgi:hypothetical protein